MDSGERLFWKTKFKLTVNLKKKENIFEKDLKF